MLTRGLEPPNSSFFLFGPRGTGKTTWIRENFSKAAAFDLLDPSESIRLNRDPGVLARETESLPKGSWIVLDEVQRAPLLLDEVQRLMGLRGHRFVLSGSSARKLRRGGANLLAGRATVRHLFPFTAHELGFRRTLEDSLAFGMLPLAVGAEKPLAVLRAYATTYLAEEVQAEALVRNIGSFARFLEVAGRINAQSVNVANVSREAQVARQTVQDYFQILVDTLLASWLPAWKKKPSVKQILHPKFYWFDSGVARQLGGLAHLSVHPEERGFLFETYLLHELRAYLHYKELDYPVFYWARRDGVVGAEVDFVIEGPGGVTAIEVKSATRWEPKFLAGLARFREEHAKPAPRCLGVYAGTKEFTEDGVRVLPWLSFLRQLWAGELIA